MPDYTNTEGVTEGDVEARLAAHRISNAAHTLQTIGTLARRWHHTKNLTPTWVDRDLRERSLGKMDAYVEAIAVLLMVEGAEVESMLRSGFGWADVPEHLRRR